MATPICVLPFPLPMAIPLCVLSLPLPMATPVYMLPLPTPMATPILRTAAPTPHGNPIICAANHDLLVEGGEDDGQEDVIGGLVGCREKPIKPNSTSPSYPVTTKVTSPTHKSQPQNLATSPKGKAEPNAQKRKMAQNKKVELHDQQIASFYAKDSPKNVGHGETSDQDTQVPDDQNSTDNVTVDQNVFGSQIIKVDSEKDQTIPTDAEPPDRIIEDCYLNTSGNILEDDYMQVVSEDKNNDISEEENDSPELIDDKHVRQLIETFGSSSQMQKVADEQGLSPRGTILLSPDHFPLLLEMTNRQYSSTKYFKFLHCWVDNLNFMDTVRLCWDRDIQGHPMWNFHQKLKRVSSTLSNWSKIEFGDIFARVKDFEVVRLAEEKYIQTNSDQDRSSLHALNAEYIRFLKLEESILKQKAQLQWFKEGNANTSYFHALMRGRRRKLFIHKVRNDNGNWIQGDDNIAKAACDHFQELFTEQNHYVREDILACIPTLVTDEQNDNLTIMPDLEELKNVGRSISENIMLAQQIVHGINQKNLGGNVVIKLDMAKAYDRVSWPLLALFLGEWASVRTKESLWREFRLAKYYQRSHPVSKKYDSEWGQLCAKVDLCIHEIRITRVSWSRPPPRLVKLNTDGSALGNPGRIGAEGILRDCNGDLIHAFASPLGVGTNNQDELEAA
uniref:Retrotransposon protein, unclassified n=1 Tax=Solanum tuberosum TaxID=4113 RepID=M1DB34_SOLTU